MDDEVDDLGSMMKMLSFVFFSASSHLMLLFIIKTCIHIF